MKIKTLRGNEYFNDLPEDIMKEIAAQKQLREAARSLRELERSGAIRIEDHRIHIADASAVIILVAVKQ